MPNDTNDQRDVFVAAPQGTSTPSPTTPPGLAQGDVNCDGSVIGMDFDFLVRFAVGLNDGTTPGSCPDLNESLTASTGGHPWGDVNCDDAVTALDALYLLAKQVEIDLAQVQPCTSIGSVLT